MSIQIGVNDSTNTKNIQIFNNERIKLYSDVQSNLLELVSGCNATSISLSNINTQSSLHIGASNYNSNIVIETYRNGDTPYKLLDMSKTISSLNTYSCIIQGNVNITNNLIITGILSNVGKPVSLNNGIRTSNLFLYATSNDYKPFSVKSSIGNTEIISLNTDTDRFIIQPNVGIGTTIALYKLQTQGPIYSSNGIYTKYISSNLNSPTIQYYGNLNVNGDLKITDNFNLSGANFNITNTSVDNLNPSRYSAISIVQQTGSNAILSIKANQGNGTSNVIFGISPYGRTYIGSDLLRSSTMSLYETFSKSNAMLNIYIPPSFINDSLIQTTSYDTSNTMILSKDAYIGIGTTIIRNPFHLYLNSNTNLLDSALSNNSSIGFYHANMQNKGLFYASSNNIPVFTIDGTGTVSIGSNNAIQFTSNGSAIIQDRLYVTMLDLLNSGRSMDTYNPFVYGLKDIQANSFVGCNINTSNISLSNSINILDSSTSNLTTNNLTVNTNANFNDFYVDNSLDGPNINIYVGLADQTYFIPDAIGNGSVAYFKTSNILISTNSNYTEELTNTIAGNSNGILQVRTYNSLTNPIAAGISIYGYNYSSAKVTASKPYYQLKRPASNIYQFGVNSDNLLCFGLSNNNASLDYITSLITIDNVSTISIGNKKTLLYSKKFNPIMVSTIGIVDSIIETGGFETIGHVYLRAANSSAGFYFDNNTRNIGIGTTIPRADLDVQGIALFQSNIEINTGPVFFNSNIGIGTTIIRKNIDILGDAIVSNNIGIGTTIPRVALDISPYMLISGNVGIGTTNVGAYSLNVSSNMRVTSSFTASNSITSQNIYGNLRGVANAANISSNSPTLINIPSLITVGTVSSSTITNIQTINVGIGTVFATSFIGSNINVDSINPISTPDITATITGAFYSSNFIVNGSNLSINPYLSINSNVLIRNQTSIGPAFSVYQSGSGPNYPVTDFYNNNISTTIPALRVANASNIGIGTSIPIANFHVQGSGYYYTSLGIGTTLPIYPLHIQSNILSSGNICSSGNIGIGTTIPLASLHLGDGEVIIPELTGMILHFASSNIPNMGWLKCNGASVSRMSYSNLFNQIGTIFGVGIGTTSFQVPDLRGEFIRGWADPDLSVSQPPASDIGRGFGTWQEDDFISHVHGMPDSLNGNKGSRGTDNTKKVADDTFDTRNTNATGGTETRPRNIAFIPCIKY